jgi:hypothetical protein
MARRADIAGSLRAVSSTRKSGELAIALKLRG